MLQQLNQTSYIRPNERTSLTHQTNQQNSQTTPGICSRITAFLCPCFYNRGHTQSFQNLEPRPPTPPRVQPFYGTEQITSQSDRPRRVGQSQQPSAQLGADFNRQAVLAWRSDSSIPHQQAEPKQDVQPPNQGKFEHVHKLLTSGDPHENILEVHEETHRDLQMKSGREPYPYVRPNAFKNNVFSMFRCEDKTHETALDLLKLRSNEGEHFIVLSDEHSTVTPGGFKERAVSQYFASRKAFQWLINAVNNIFDMRREGTSIERRAKIDGDCIYVRHKNNEPYIEICVDRPMVSSSGNLVRIRLTQIQFSQILENASKNGFEASAASTDTDTSFESLEISDEVRTTIDKYRRLENKSILKYKEHKREVQRRLAVTNDPKKISLSEELIKKRIKDSESWRSSDGGSVRAMSRHSSQWALGDNDEQIEHEKSENLPQEIEEELGFQLDF